MKLTNRKIKKLIRESLRKILFESEERIENLKDQFNLVYQKLSRAKSQEEFDQLNAEAERLDKEINRLTRTMFKEPEDPGEFDFMETDPLQPPMLSRGTEVGSFQDEIDPLDRPAMIDVSDGEGNELSGGPMTQRDMNRRDFLQNVGVGVGASAFLGRQIIDSDALFANADPRLKITSDWFARAIHDGTFAKMYSHILGPDFYETYLAFGETIEQKQDIIIEYITDAAPEELFEALITEYEKAGYNDPYEDPSESALTLSSQIDALIDKRLREYYTPDKIKQLRGR